MSALAVLAPRRFGRLLAGDAMNVARDPMLLFAAGMSLLPALALHYAQPALDAGAAAAFGLADASRLIVPMALTIPAVLVGWVTGFLLLEDRDEGTLLALDVTPIGKSGFLAYRSIVTALLGAGVTLYAWPLLLPGAPLPLALALAVVVGLNAVGAAVALPAFARNKVEGLALTKLVNLLSLAPLLAAVPSPLRYLGGILPTYWIGELTGLSEVAPLPLPATVALGLGTGAVAVLLLFRRLGRRAG